jgi:hypothetical protein
MSTTTAAVVGNDRVKRKRSFSTANANSAHALLPCFSDSLFDTCKKQLTSFVNECITRKLIEIAKEKITVEIHKNVVESSKLFMMDTPECIPKYISDILIQIDIEKIVVSSNHPWKVYVPYNGSAIGNHFKCTNTSSNAQFSPDGCKGFILQYSKDAEFSIFNSRLTTMEAFEKLWNDNQLDKCIQVTFPNAVDHPSEAWTLDAFCSMFAQLLVIEYKQWCKLNPKQAATNIAK